MKETIFCIISAFILYEVSGIIGKEMLADKHITGEGKGYCDITFGKESKKSLIINIQYNIFAPIIYMLLIATVLQNIEPSQDAAPLLSRQMGYDYGHCGKISIV